MFSVHQLCVDQIPVTGGAAEVRRTDLLLPAGVGQWINAAMGQDQALRHLDGREPGVDMVEPTPDPSPPDTVGMAEKR